MPSARPTTRLCAALLALVLGGAACFGAHPAMAADAPEGLLAARADARSLAWNEAVKQLVEVDVVFLGEQHGDPATHRLELAVLQALHEAHGQRLILSLEMFERDVQPILDAYLQDRIPESEFLAESRPWPNYASDYRPLVEYAKAHGLRVIAANVPRRLAAMVSREGLAALDSLDAREREWAAGTVDCPKDRLWERFQETMQGHPGMDDAVLERMYLAQCLKDATMAESIAEGFDAAVPPPVVLHVNGAFHSDEGLGVPARLERLSPALKRLVTTVLPVEEGADPPSEALADLVFMVQREKSE